MGIEQLQAEIEAQTSKIESDILGSANDKAKDIVKQAEENAKKLESTQSRELTENAAVKERKEKAMRESATQKLEHETQAEVVDSVYAQARDHINGMDENKRADFLNTLLERAGKEIEIGTVLVNKQDQKLVKTDAQVIDADIDGGMICETKDGKMRVDLSFSTLFEQTKKKTLQQVTKILFA